MGRLDSLLDDKLREKNRNLVLGYIQKRATEERARQKEQSAKMNTAPMDNGAKSSIADSSPSYPSLNSEVMNSAGDESLAEKYRSNMQFGGIHDAPVSLPFKLPKMNPVENNGNGYNWSEKQGAIGNAEQSVQKPHVELTEKDYDKLWQDYSKSHPKRIPDNYNGRADFAPSINPMGEEEYKSLLKGDYEKSGEYQFLNELSKNPIGGRIAPLFGTAWNAIQSSIAGAEGVVNTAHQLVSKEKLKPESMTQQFKSNAVRAGTLRSLRNNLGFNYDDGVESTGEKVTDFLGGVALDSTASAARALTTGMGSLLLSSGTAANQEYLDDSVNPNITRNQMLASGVAKGIAESAWEYLPTSRFLELSKNGLGTTGKEIAKNIFKQSMQEGLEEFGTDLTNDVTDYLIKGKESDVAKDYLARRANGESDLTAKMHTATDRIGSAGMSFLGGALSGGMSAGMAGVNHTLNNGFNYNDLDGHYKEIAESADTSTEEGKVIYDVANRLAEKEARGEKVTLADKGYLANAVENAEIVDYNKLQETPIDLGAIKNDVNEARAEAQEGTENAQQGGSVPYALFSDTETGRQAKTDSLINNAFNNYANNSEQNSAERYLNDKANLKEFTKNYDTEGKKAFVENYDGNIPLTDYIKASTHAYNLGRYSYTLNGEDSLDKTASMALLTKEQRENLFKAGIKDNNDAMKKWKVNYKERITKREGGLMDSVPHAPMNLKNLLEKLGRKTGILFRITDSKYQDGDYANGSYEKGKGIITVDLQSDNILGTISHEMTHWIKEYTSEGDDLGVYGWFKGLALNSILKSRNTDLDSLIETYKQSYGNLSNEEITDEIVADSTMHFLNDEEFINKLVNGTEEQKSLGMKVVQWLNDIIESFKDLISHNGERLASRALREDLARYEETRDAWLVAMSKAKENMARNEAVTENSDSGELSQVQLQKIINQGKAHEQLLDHIYQTGTHNNQYVYIQETPKILTKILGIDSLPMVMDVEHVVTVQAKNQTEIEQKLNLTPQQAQYKTAHKLTAKEILDDIKAIDNPAFIIRSDDKGKDCSFVVVTNEYDSDGKRVIVAVQPSDNFNYSKISIVSNRIKSLYGRNRFGNYLHNYESNIIYVDPSERHMKYFYKEENRGAAPTYESLVLPATSVISANLARFQMDVNKILQNVDPKSRNNSSKAEPHFQTELQNFVNSQSNNTGNTTSGTNTLHQLDISEEYYNSLVEENEKVKEENRYLTDVLNAEKRHEPKASDVNKIAKDILEKYGSSFGKKQLAEQLTGFYHYLKTAEHIDAGEVRSVSQAIANEVLSNTTYKDKEEVKEYQAIKDFFYNRPIYVTERELHDLGYDTYSELRKNYFRKIDFRKATEDHRGNSDQVYQSFSNAFPHLVYGRRSYTDEISNMIDALETVEPKEYEAYSGEEFEQAVDRLSDEIYEAYYSVGEASLYSKYKQSYAKVKETARAELKAEYEKKYNKTVERLLERERKNEGKDSKSLEEIKQLKEDYKNSLISHEEFIREEAKILGARGLEYQARLEMHRAYREKQDEQLHRQLYKKNIIRDSKALMKMAVQPTDNLHVPKVLLKDLVPVLSAVDFSSTRFYEENPPKINMSAEEFGRNLETLNKRIADAEKNGFIFTEENGKSVYFDLDPNLVEDLRTVREAVKDIGGNMNRLSTEDLKTLRDSLQVFKHAVETQNKFVSGQNNEKISDVSEEIVDDLKKEKAGIQLVGILQTAKDGIELGMLDSYSYFYNMGKGGEKVIKMLRAGRDNKTLAVADIGYKIATGIQNIGLTPKDIQNFTKDKVSFAVTNLSDMSEQTIEMKKAQLMSMYMYTLRDQGRMHLFGEILDDETGERHEGDVSLGGFKLKETKMHKLSPIMNRDTNTYKITSKQLNAVIREHLNSKEIAYADMVGKLLSEDLARYGNEASMKVYGYEKFLEGNYFPIKVDSDSITMKNQDLEKAMTTLKNKGMTKALKKEAYNPIIIDDITEVMAKHIDEMTSYYAYFPVIQDMQKVYNVTGETGNSVHREISRVMGNGGTQYYMNLIRDLNGSRTDDSYYSKLAYGFSGAYKGALIGNNLRVAVQQPMSYMRAMAVIETKYLMEGLTLPLDQAEKEWELCQKYAPIAKWKAMGGSYDVNVGVSMRKMLTGEKTGFDKFREASFYLLEKGDEAAWKRLWYASEKKVEATTNLKRGTEEFYKASADIFNDIIDKTQVVDSVLNRTDIMKDKNVALKMASSFMSEPSKTYNMAYRLLYDIKKGKATPKEAASVVASILVSSAMVSAAASIISAMRDRDKEKKFGERWLTHFIDDYFQNINPITWVVFAKDGIQAIYNAAKGKAYLNNNLAVKPIMDLMNGVKELGQIGSKNRKDNIVNGIYKFTNVFMPFGVSIHNALRDMGAVYDTIIYDSPFASPKAQYDRDSLMFNIEHRRTKKQTVKDENGKEQEEKVLQGYDYIQRFLRSAFKAYARGDQKTGDYIIEDMKKHLGDEAVNKAMQRTLSKNETVQEMAKKKLDGETIDEEQEELRSLGYSDAMIDKALESAVKKLKPIENQDLAEKLFENTEDSKDSLNEFVEYQKSLGKDENKIRSSIKTAVTSKYKSLYQEAIGNPEESDEILKKILRITYNGKQLYTESDLKKWAK